MTNKRKRLLEILDVYALRPKQVADMLKRSEQTVRIWMCDGGKEIPDHMLDLLEERVKSL